MPRNHAGSPNQKTECKACPLRRLEVFRPFSAEELEFISSFKRGELVADRGATILAEGAASPHLYTILAGWAFRYKILEDGRRQILNYTMPGDLIGLQVALMKEVEHSIEALTPVRLCMFERSSMMSLYEAHAELGFDVTWLAAREERMLDEHLLSVGRRTALERAAYLLASLHLRWSVLNAASGMSLALPLTQQHVADTLGLSLVHTNKTLRKLAVAGLIAWTDGGCKVLKVNALVELANWDRPDKQKRPII